MQNGVKLLLISEIKNEKDMSELTNNSFWLYTHRMQGARQMLVRLQEMGKLNLAPFITKSKGKKVYEEALYKWLISDLLHIEAFLNGEEYVFCDFEKDAKGKLVKCRVELKGNNK